MTHLKTFMIWSSNIFKCEFCLVGDQNMEGRRPTLGQSLQSNCKSECVFTNYSTFTSPSPQINWDYRNMRPLFFLSLHWHGAYSHRCSYLLETPPSVWLKYPHWSDHILVPASCAHMLSRCHQKSGGSSVHMEESLWSCFREEPWGCWTLCSLLPSSL